MSARRIEDWERLDPSVSVYGIGEQPAEFHYWQDVYIDDRIEAVERLRREYHGWSRGNEPALERTACIVELP